MDDPKVVSKLRKRFLHPGVNADIDHVVSIVRGTQEVEAIGVPSVPARHGMIAAEMDLDAMMDASIGEGEAKPVVPGY